jgi:hypothetical protein
MRDMEQENRCELVRNAQKVDHTSRADRATAAIRPIETGIGLALGRGFAEAGCKVMLADLEKGSA